MHLHRKPGIGKAGSGGIDNGAAGSLAKIRGVLLYCLTWKSEDR
jgi:hypothetical protein